MCVLRLIVDNEIRTATVKVSDWKAEIKIYQCPPDVDGESFYIYLLASAPADQTAYCAGEGEHCPPGYMHNGINCVGKCRHFHGAKF